MTKTVPVWLGYELITIRYKIIKNDLQKSEYEMNEFEMTKLSAKWPNWKLK